MENINQPKQPMFKKSKILMTKKRMIIGVIIAIILVSGGVGSWIYYSNKKSASDQKVVPVAQGQELLTQTQAEISAIVNYGGDPNKAAAIIDNSVNNANDDQTKSDLLLQKTIMYFNASNYDEAIASGLQSEAIIKNENVENMIASSYEQKGDTQNAILYYQEAMAQVSTTDPAADAKIKNYQSMIDALGKVK
jgi:tetratricopeptide (TPR) repeat protein